MVLAKCVGLKKAYNNFDGEVNYFQTVSCNKMEIYIYSSKVNQIF